MSAELIGELHKSLNILCRAHVVLVEDDHGGFLGTRNEAPLYAKLRAATIGGRGDGGKGISARESTPLNVSAVDLHNLIAKRIRTWYADELALLGSRAPRNLAAERVDITTIRWASLVVQRNRRGELSDEGMAKRVHGAEQIVRSIRDLLDPPYRFELTSPCPRCGAEFTEQSHSRVLVVTEVKPLDKSFVTCLACGKEWKGIHEARMLTLELDGAL